MDVLVNEKTKRPYRPSVPVRGREAGRPGRARARDLRHLRAVSGEKTGLTLSWLLVSWLVVVSSARGGSLSRAVPSDVTLYFHVQIPAVSPPTEGLCQALSDVRGALSGASFIPRLAAYLDEAVAANKRHLLDPELEYWRELLEENSWWKLFRNEFFLAGRLEIDRRAWLLGFRVSAAERELFLSRFRELLKAFVAILPASELDVGQRRGSSVTCLYSLIQPSHEFCAAGRDDIVLLSTSRRFLRQAIQLLEGESSDVPFDLGRTAGVGRLASLSSARESVEWLSARSRFLRSRIGPPESRTVMVTPSGWPRTRILTSFTLSSSRCSIALVKR